MIHFHNLPKNRALGLSVLGLCTGFAITALPGCDGDDGPGIPGGEELCGECGSIASGQLSISGNAQLDGFFKAVADFRGVTGRVKGTFDADILALAKLYGIAEARVDANFVGEVRAAIEADIAAHADGGLKITYEAPSCQADVSVAVEAQASCEIQAGCEVQADPGMASVQCEGSCTGSCSGSCSGSLSCAVKTPTVACEGSCEGSCQLDAAAACEGTCNGTCEGTCSATDADGNCAGSCDGMCTGTCELDGQASCSGTCHGTCYVEQGSAQCTAEAECSGSCDAECSGSCEGSFEPPSASADCDASADCQAQASAQAEANVSCKPPRLEVGYQLQAGLDATAQAEFVARMKEFKVRAASIMQGFAQLKALVDGEVDGEVVFDPSPSANLVAQIEGLISVGFEGGLEIPPGRLPCVLPAFNDALTTLQTAAGEATTTVTAQASFAALITG